MLFGGTDLVSFSDETWEWDGASWSQKTPAVSPPPRYGQGVAFDASHGITVLFGGFDETYTPLGDTWEWNGSAWTQRMPISPPSSRWGAGMDYDSARDVSVLFGGDTGSPDGETWERLTAGPTITQEPADLSVAAGQPAAFTVVAGGTGGANSFSWRKNGAPLSDGGAIIGSQTATLTINPTSNSDAGSYDVVVTNSCGSVTSRAATLDTCAGSGSDDCNGNGVLDACDIAADPSLDADNNGTLDSCEGGDVNTQPPCGLCGGGTATMMPLALLTLGIRGRLRRRR